MSELLHLEDVSVSFSEWETPIRLLENISFAVDASSIVAVVGESGSGKTTLAQSITRLFARPERYSVKGSILFKGQEIVGASENQLQHLRRKNIRYIFQEPAQSLNPLLRIGTQIHDAAGERHERPDSASLLLDVGLDNPERILKAFPHELSIGMLQRVTIAMALSSSPELIIADEPTSAIDPPLRSQVLDLFSSIRQRLGISFLIITHDPSIPTSYADHIVVLNSGRIFEISPRDQFAASPLHPYSRTLIDARSSLYHFQSGHPALNPDRELRGCRFRQQCPLAKRACEVDEPMLEKVDQERFVRCFFWK
jgi:oligopeptide/dipeptide ABC transporter ATP-binding protein